MAGPGRKRIPGLEALGAGTPFPSPGLAPPCTYAPYAVLRLIVGARARQGLSCSTVLLRTVTM